jgi:hypothetical protein
VAGAAIFPAVTSAATGALPVERDLLTTGLRTSILGAAVQVDAAADTQNSQAVAIGVAAQPFGVSTLVRQVFYRGPFVDETIAFSSAEKPSLSHTEINTDFNVRAMKNTLLPLTIRGTFDVFADHSTQATAGFRASSTFNNVLVSGGFDLQNTTGPGVASVNTTTGNLALSTFYQFKWQLRADLDYAVTPKFALNDLSITADRDLGGNQSLRLGIGQGFGGGSGTTFQLGDVMHTSRGDFSFTGNYTAPLNQWQLGLTFATGLVFDPYAKRYVMTRPGPAQSGSVAFQAFVDSNGNGVYDPGEKPVPDVSVDGGDKRTTTNAKGQAFLTNVGSGPSGRLQVGLDAIEDPYVQSPPQTVVFSPRAGLVIKAPYPLTSSSEIIVHIMLMRDGKKTGLSAVRLTLVPRKGKAALDGATEFDGSAGFENLSSGIYDLKLDPEQAARLHMRLKAPVQIVVPNIGGPLPDVTGEVTFDQDRADDAASAPTPAAAATH